MELCTILSRKSTQLELSYNINNEFSMKRLLEKKIQKKFFSQLVEKFGDTAKSQKQDFLMTEEIANELFDFLNETIFENQIPKIHISVEKFDKNVHKNKVGQYFIGQHRVDIKVKDIDDSKLNFRDVHTLPYVYRIIIVNFKPTYFCNYVSVICHEMIHAMDFNYGLAKEDFIIKLYNALLDISDNEDEYSYDHHSEYFEQWQKSLSQKYGIIVEKDYEMTRKYEISEHENFIAESDNIRPAVVSFVKKIWNGIGDKDHVSIRFSNEHIQINIA